MNFTNFGRYILLLKSVFRRPEKLKIYLKEIAKQMDYVGVGSLGLIAIISTFIGAVMTLQIAFQLVSDFIPKTIIGSVNRDSSILELSPTISAIVLAGKIGSAISSEIGSMRVTEQIDALEIMGINAPGYLILPKIISGITMVPMLVIISMFLSITGGYIGGSISGAVTPAEYIQGITTDFNPYTITVALVKAFVFGFIITSVPAYEGFYVRGGALEVSQASTRAVVISCISILVCDYLVTQLLL
ncbi:ABC transporter permease [Pedobacter sp. ISL-68]|jgi:phospholipid/cholesterol/gamma-HCH transport system permease protein|uniref:ABC transporter permease n=2 Tax=Pedobacter TaxID=84567 RepID=A0A0T5VQZ4_9SPHI|nr:MULTISPECIES: ABC transporter permease [Pedobacter]MDQ0969856.1 phospholipid/cholesterol/gamma-HCH transport system permease protein [Flavobacterium sp. W4I14]KRT16307.1 ABC transporter permease [Pedobacter ginsenosidimutans]MBT2563687.1 ABC transporter permease [Pedobacter sp. ISL-64]MBT2589579.1 ABC transporter permease [Pedobacter sp. ISL-68]TBO40272.1 ABC transporter permease [Pedobacter kyonggii]